MPLETDPTQQGGQEAQTQPALQLAHGARNAAMQQIASRVHAAAAEDLADFDEDSGKIEERKAAPAVEPAEVAQEEEVVAEAEPKPAEPPAPRTVQIVVHGETIEVPEDKIIEAGKRTLQKESSADKRLQEAEAKRREAESLLRQAQELQQRLSGNPDAEQPAPSEQDAPRNTPQQLDPAALGRFMELEMEQKLYERDAQKAVKVFEAEFPEVASDPVLRGFAAKLEDERMQHAMAVGEPLGDPIEAYRKHGETVRQWLQERTGNKPTVPQDKQERKRTITTVPAANARAPAPQEKKQLSTAEQIEQMRTSRRQGSPVERVLPRTWR